MQVKLYALGLKAIGQQVAFGSIAYLDEGIIKPVSIEDKDLEKVKPIVSECLRNIMNNSFQGKVGKHCMNDKSQKCDYYNICKYAQKKERFKFVF